MTYKSPTTHNAKRLPIGYQYMVKGYVKFITIHPVEIKAVKYAFMTMADSPFFLGELCRIIKKAFDVHITPHRMKDILIDPFYCGFIGDVKHIYEPIITREIFDRVQHNLSSNKITPAKNAEKSKHKYKYIGIFKCDECGSNISGTVVKGHIYYYCINPNAKHKKKNTNEKIIDKEFMHILSALDATEDLYSIKEINTILRGTIVNATIGYSGIKYEINQNANKEAVSEILSGAFMIKEVQDIDLEQLSDFERFLLFPRSAEEIMQEFNLDLTETLNKLMDLQLDSKVEETEGGKWKIV